MILFHSIVFSNHIISFFSHLVIFSFQIDSFHQLFLSSQTISSHQYTLSSQFIISHLNSDKQLSDNQNSQNDQKKMNYNLLKSFFD